MQPLLDGLAGQRVAVVGNASSLLSFEHGAEIDAHQCVIRFNRGFQALPPAATGVRWDIWAVGARMDPQVLDAVEARRPSSLVWARAPVCDAKTRFEQNAKGRWPEVVLFDPGLRKEIAIALGDRRPTTGLLLIAALAQRSQAKAIDVYGFDFFATPTFRADPMMAQIAHAPDRERALFESYLQKDARLRWVRDA